MFVQTGAEFLPVLIPGDRTFEDNSRFILFDILGFGD